MAEHICNKEYLFEFYRHLNFDNQKIAVIDEYSLKFKNLTVISLIQNDIKVNKTRRRSSKTFPPIAKSSTWISTKFNRSNSRNRTA
jgi:hypothetical protein